MGADWASPDGSGDPTMAANVLQFKLHKTNAAQPYHWTLVSVANGQVICHSENYARKADAKHSLNLVYANAGDATLNDLTGEA